MTYFKLNPGVFLIVGKQKSLIQDVVEEKIFWIENNFAEMIKRGENGSFFKNEELHLLKSFFSKYSSLGTFSDKPIFIDKFRPINIYNEKKLHKNTPFLRTATLQISNECNLSCNFCSTSFCPSCKIIKEDPEALSFEEWLTVVDQLASYGVSTILLTGGEAAISPFFKDLVRYILNKGISLSVHTNGFLKSQQIPQEVHLIVSLFESDSLNAIVRKYRNHHLTTAILYSCNNKVRPSIIPASWQVKFSRTSPLPITKQSMVNTDFDSFFSRKMTDNCLDEKLLISYNGNVYPCMGFKQKVGTVYGNQLHLAIRTLLTNYWKKNSDHRSGKCQQCEFRYACNACSFFDLEFCQYNVEEGQWISSLNE
ncbi:radical SAM/SPASM domain-containing protein [Saccharibacillus sp. O23]|uniref:radical SAM/SPASM domain-containing protein n=1 Tax=Saccharibacillus sp. O23 TaxID=2009338 RepID=UPI0015C5A163|nr:radical SAM protein [Saccharibacillus sp. O23]